MFGGKHLGGEALSTCFDPRKRRICVVPLKTCTCKNGIAATISCAADGKEQCVRCNDDEAYFLTKQNTCVPACQCANGIAVQPGQGPCDEPFKEVCKSCFPGYALDPDNKLECIPVCRCLHGEPQSLGSCTEAFQEKCEIRCKPGFRYDADTKICVGDLLCNLPEPPKPYGGPLERDKCKCTAGVPVLNKDCPVYNIEMCDKCNSRGSFVDPYDRCQVKRCVCDNGNGAIGKDCGTHGTFDCNSCDIGFHLEDVGGTAKICAANECVCEDGVAARGKGCETHNGKSCAFCFPFEGVVLTKLESNLQTKETICKKRRCKCGKGGSPYEGDECPGEGVTFCKFCANGYKMVVNENRTRISCEPVCHCANGRPESSRRTPLECTEPGARCHSCFAGFVFEPSEPEGKKTKCVPACTCAYGTPPPIGDEKCAAPGNIGTGTGR